MTLMWNQTVGYGHKNSSVTINTNPSSPLTLFSVLFLFLISEDNNQEPTLSRVELYLEACHHTKAVPVKSFLRNLDNAHVDLNHYGLGPLGAKALAIALRVGLVSDLLSK